MIPVLNSRAGGRHPDVVAQNACPCYLFGSGWRVVVFVIDRAGLPTRLRRGAPRRRTEGASLMRSAVFRAELPEQIVDQQAVAGGIIISVVSCQILDRPRLHPAAGTESGRW